MKQSGMNRIGLMGATFLLLGMGVVGCQNTAEGVAQDTARNTEAAQRTAETAGQEIREETREAGRAVENATENAAATVREGAADAGAALTVTPKVKNAILQDNQLANMLNNTAYSIDVDSTEEKVMLKGTVSTNAMKRHAEDVAKRTLKDMNDKRPVVNQLMVSSR